jgi:hypothetical protein
MVTTATLQTIWDCRWSRPGYRVLGVQDHLQPEKLRFDRRCALVLPSDLVVCRACVWPTTNVTA